MSNDREEIQSTSAAQYTHSIKVQETRSGLRFSIHVYGNNEDETIETTLRTYEKTRVREAKVEIMTTRNGIGDGGTVTSDGSGGGCLDC